MAPKSKPRIPRPRKPRLHVPEVELKLDLGCGQNCREGFEGVDRFAPNAKHKVHLWSGERWPWADSSVSELNCTHVIEHIDAGWVYPDGDRGRLEGAKDAFLFFFDEAWRIAKPGATFRLQWPALQSVRAFMDPTHRRFIPLQTMMYLDRNWREMNKLGHYLGSCDWVLESGTPTTDAIKAKLPDPVQQRLYIESWNFSEDFIVFLRARKT